jgi:hypothetical protein
MRFSTIVLVLLLVGLATPSALAQGAASSISGQVREARTQRPLAFASVFLANTTYGTTTDSTGHFVLAGLPGGHYELMVSYVGYQLFQKPLDLQLPLTLVADLQPTATQLDEVVVHPKKNRPSDYKMFLQQFLGNSTLSQQCRLDNPDDVVVVYDKAHHQLQALAPRSLRVINQALGYRITYYNFDFKVFYTTNRCEFVAAPMFEELKSPDARQQQRWEEARRRAYAGSLPHFLRSVRANRLAEEGFVVRAMVVELASEQASQRAARAADSLAEVRTPEPGLTARVYKQPLSAAQLCRPEASPSARVRLQFPYTLQVTYQAEQPDAVYTTYMADVRRTQALDAARRLQPGSKHDTALGRPLFEAVKETSELRLLGPDAVILPNGYLHNPLSVKVDGYWAFEKVGEALPLDYTPAPLK